MRRVCAWIAVLLFAATVASGADNDTNAGLDGLKEVEFAQLSQVDPTPLGQKALAIHPEQWKHAETEHFIYHFVHDFVATPISVEAEFNYRVIMKELGREEPAGDTKSHIYIFERPQDWQEFQKVGRLELWSGGIHAEGSLFIVRNPAYRFSNNSLGHEIAHLILHRFYTGGIPCWLDEGFAQYISKDAQASYQRARGYMARPRSESIAAADLISVAELTAFATPPSDRVVVFYNEAERLVRFLAMTDKTEFLAFLDALGRHQPFESALLRI